MKFDFVVIGANGTQGKITAKDLLENGFKVLLAAIDDFQIEHLIDYDNAEFAQIDLRQEDRVKRVIKKSGAKIVLNCAIDDFNLSVSKICLDLGVNYVDLDSLDHITEAQLAMNDDYKSKGIVGITGMGSTPGINNVMLRHIRPKFDTIHTVHLGFAWQANMETFVSPFSLDAIGWEFVEPAKVLEKGNWILKEHDDWKFDYDYLGIGKQKTYFTPHAEYYTMHRYLKDAGIKNIYVGSSFPEFSYKILRTLVDLGFMNKNEKINIDGDKVQPLAFTIELIRRIPRPKGYLEKENIWLKAFGKKDGKEKQVDMDAVIGTLPGWEDAGCNIDTGMPVSITGQMIKDGRINTPGFYTPEFLIPPEPFFQELAKRKIKVYENRKKIN
jgi:saccharopine dehydrogenase-like NADP-dependent oxidoreductase